MTTREHINHEPNNPEAWNCVCGNTPDADGFYPCDSGGREVAPTLGDWTGCYVCAGCGRIIDQKSLEVLGARVLSSPAV